MALDANGWTILTPSVDTITYYVSATGDDGNDGLTEGTPLLTPAAARAKLRDGYPDWILLKRGDTFTDLRLRAQSGRSETEPLVISSYGTGARPILTGRLWYYSANESASYVFRYLIISGLDFQGDYQQVANPSPAGMQFFGERIHNITIEGCRIENYDIGVHIEQGTKATLTNFTFRRNVFVNNASQGILASDITTLLIEESIFDNNGNGESGGATIYNHNVYLFEVDNATLHDNIFARASNFGSKLSSDNPNGLVNFIVTDNLYYKNALSMDHSFGISHDPEVEFSHRDGDIASNVFVDTYKVLQSVAQDMSLWIHNAIDIDFRANIFAHKTSTATNALAAYHADGFFQNITYDQCIVYDWTMNASYDDLPTDYFNSRPELFVGGYAATDNQYDQSAGVYRDPTRTIGGYYASIGGTNDAVAFLAAASEMSKDNWNTQYTAEAVNGYIREGFVRSDRTYLTLTASGMGGVLVVAANP